MNKYSLERYTEIYNRIFLLRMMISIILNDRLKLRKNATVVMFYFRIGRAQ